MDIERVSNDLEKIISEESVILVNEPMSKHTSFKIGGNADIFIKAKTEEDIKQILKYSEGNNIPLTIVGNGSDLLVKDGGIRGIVVKVDIDIFEIIDEIEGFEFASGIPGSIGGALRMNAGAHGSEMKDIVLETMCMDKQGNICVLSNEEQEFEYRNSIFKLNKYIILSTKLKLKKGIYKEIKEKMDEYANWRKEHQPIEYPSAGSTFKRGTDFITAKLIDECGLKGYSIGDAEVSIKHAGFVINKGNAKAKEVIDLIEYIKEKVADKFGKEIELEVQIIGEDAKK